MFLVLPLTTQAEDTESTARNQLSRLATDLETLQADFAQIVVGADGEVHDESSGQVWLARPDRFRWEYGGDFPEKVIADGTTIWIYDEVLEQVTVRTQQAETSSSPLALLTHPEELDNQFEVREAGNTDEYDLLELRSRSRDAEFERILLGLNGDVLVLMILEDAFGLRTEIRFESVQTNLSLDVSLFEFSPPPGVDVIGAPSG